MSICQVVILSSCQYEHVTMSICDNVNSVAEKKNGDNSALYPMTKEKQDKSFPDMENRSQDRLLSLCAEVEPAICLTSR